MFGKEDTMAAGNTHRHNGVGGQDSWSKTAPRHETFPVTMTLDDLRDLRIGRIHFLRGDLGHPAMSCDFTMKANDFISDLCGFIVVWGGLGDVSVL